MFRTLFCMFSESPVALSPLLEAPGHSIGTGPTRRAQRSPGDGAWMRFMQGGSGDQPGLQPLPFWVWNLTHETSQCLCGT